MDRLNKCSERYVFENHTNDKDILPLFPTDIDIQKLQIKPPFKIKREVSEI